jgi:hypothetical protein
LFLVRVPPDEQRETKLIAASGGGPWIIVHWTSRPHVTRMGDRQQRVSLGTLAAERYSHSP